MAVSRKIIPVTEEEQLAFLDKDDISVARNKESGWPLFELGIFYPIKEKDELDRKGKEGYAPVVGGGKCQYIPYGVYGFARLLQQNKKVNFDETVAEPGFFAAVSSAHGGAEIKTKSKKLQLSVEYNPYAKDEVVITFNGNQKGLSKLLYNLPDEIARKIPFQSGWKSDTVITEDIFEKYVDPEYATFFNGKIYVDLEKILDKANVDADTKEAFKDYFDVDVYLQKQKRKKFESDFEKNEIDKIKLSDIKNDLQKLTAELAKEKKKFKSADKAEHATMKDAKYQALGRLYNYIQDHTENPYIKKSEFVSLYKNI